MDKKLKKRKKEDQNWIQSSETDNDGKYKRYTLFKSQIIWISLLQIMILMKIEFVFYCYL